MMANQHLKQLSGATLDAVLGNVGAAVAFQCSKHDAQAVASLRPGFTAPDLMHQDKYKAGVFMRYKGETQPAFSLETLPAAQPTSEEAGRERERALRRQSRARYTRRSREEIMDWLNERYLSTAAGTGGDGRVQDDFYD